MRYRILVRTELIASKIGFGGHEHRLLKWVDVIRDELVKITGALHTLTLMF